MIVAGVECIVGYMMFICLCLLVHWGIAAAAAIAAAAVAGAASAAAVAASAAAAAAAAGLLLHFLCDTAANDLQKFIPLCCT